LGILILVFVVLVAEVVLVVDVVMVEGVEVVIMIYKHLQPLKPFLTSTTNSIDY
jgi:hypothetical protein